MFHLDYQLYTMLVCWLQEGRDEFLSFIHNILKAYQGTKYLIN